jgi:curved DNA-binding protein
LRVQSNDQADGLLCRCFFLNMDYKDYYKILGVEKTATTDQIKKAYRKLARQYHPDVNPNDPKAEQKFKEANEANEVLSDPEKRQKYDQLGADYQRYQQGSSGRGPGTGAGGFDWSQYAQGGGGAGFGGGEGEDFSDFFSSMFGGARGGRSSRPGAGGDYQAELELTLQEAYEGGPRTITVNGKNLRITIQPGVADGQTIRLRDQGGPGRNGGPNGSLLITLRILPDARYARTGDDLTQDVPVPLYRALLGGEQTVETLGGPVKIKLKPETANGSRLRLRGKGFPVYREAGKHGDLYLRLNVQLPTNLTEEERSLIQQLAQLRGEE